MLVDTRRWGLLWPASSSGDPIYGCARSLLYSLSLCVHTAVDADARHQTNGFNCIAGGVSHKHGHSGGSQLGCSRLVSCTYTTAEAWTGCKWGSLALLRLGRDSGSWCRDSKYLWGESWRDHRGSMAAVLAVGFIHGKICWVCYRGSLWTVISSAARLLIILSAFLPCSKLAQYVSALPICVRWNQTGICVVLCEGGEAKSFTSFFISWQKELLAGVFFLGVEQYLLGDGMIQAKQSSSFFLVHLFSGWLVCFTVLLILPKWAPEVFWSYFFVPVYWSDCWSSWGHVEAGFSNVAFCSPSKLIQEITFWNTFITPLKFYIS